MQNFKIAVAQIPSVKGRIEENIQTHIEAVECASAHAVSMIVFPELSLTGYEPQLAGRLAIKVSDARLQPFRDMAIQHRICVVIGAPLKSDDRPEIGAIIFYSNGQTDSYAKMHLHPGEEHYFRPGNEIKLLDIQNQSVALAICADTNSPLHARACADKGASVYVAGALIGGDGYVADTEKLSSYAREHKMLVTMANHNQPTGNWKPIGKSAAWDHGGCLAVASESTKALVISQQIDGHWRSEVVALSSGARLIS
ncbi:carbon-nitrogen hydrolase family protein [Marinobacter sp. R17]|uniref:carbon-nitrogen hydrolase family protein n=1 Tax=Marinobacter sp. R17 TaxID=2484250 RepID=UPI000F4AFDD2|nr:carbon-nitrogen hydrolase family protein [Marinobacter sp. R17]ROU02271.1 carbon-nitrogen hydrolase family protein [Marinobacter sp. R17]